MKSNDVNLRIGFFISPHGFGHATRAAAVMAAIRTVLPGSGFEIFTLTPRWLFESSLGTDFAYHELLTDVGLVQLDPLREDLSQTIARLDAYLPYDPALVAKAASVLKETSCRLVVCDISPLGIAVAREAGVPSVLIENFTWHWIYEAYIEREPGIGRHVAFMKEICARADYHIQTEPVCRPVDADLTVPPVSRNVRQPARLIRASLGIPDAKKIVVITMGGVRLEYDFHEQLHSIPDVHFIIPGGDTEITTRANVTSLPWNSHLYHPDLINAADAVIGKVGYSTLAEVYHAGVPFGYIGRKVFRESAVLIDYIAENIPGVEIEEEQFRSGTWVSVLPELLKLPRSPGREQDGAIEIARFIVDLGLSG